MAEELKEGEIFPDIPIMVDPGSPYDFDGTPSSQVFRHIIEARLTHTIGHPLEDE